MASSGTEPQASHVQAVAGLEVIGGVLEESAEHLGGLLIADGFFVFVDARGGSQCSGNGGENRDDDLDQPLCSFLFHNDERLEVSG